MSSDSTFTGNTDRGWLRFSVENVGPNDPKKLALCSRDTPMPPFADGRGLYLTQLGDLCSAAKQVNDFGIGHGRMIGIPNNQMQGTPNRCGVRLAYMANWNSRLKARREALGMTPAELARRVGVKPPTVFEWEDEQTKNLKAKNLLKIATVLGVTPDWLLTGKGGIGLDIASPGTNTPEKEIPADVLELARQLMSLTARQREALMAVAETYRSVKAAARSTISKKEDQDVTRSLPARRRRTRQPAESK